MTVQFIKTESGEELAVIPRAEYEAMLAALGGAADPQTEADEDAEDIAIFDARMAALSAGADQALPAEISALLLKGNSLVKAARLWRGLGQSVLAEKVGIGQGYLSDIEHGRRQGAPELRARLAKALRVPKDWMK
jgi:ribosome-binding protein aMBF1 (putative translation factor)